MQIDLTYMYVAKIKRKNSFHISEQWMKECRVIHKWLNIYSYIYCVILINSLKIWIKAPSSATVTISLITISKVLNMKFKFKLCEFEISSMHLFGLIIQIFLLLVGLLCVLCLFPSPGLSAPSNVLEAIKCATEFFMVSNICFKLEFASRQDIDCGMINQKDIFEYFKKLVDFKKFLHAHNVTEFGLEKRLVQHHSNGTLLDILHIDLLRLGGGSQPIHNSDFI